jgi:hypothetical protein
LYPLLVNWFRSATFQGVMQEATKEAMFRVDGEGFEPSKPVATDLQSVPFDRSGTRPDVLCERLSFSAIGTELAKGLEPATC